MAAVIGYPFAESYDVIEDNPVLYGAFGTLKTFDMVILHTVAQSMYLFIEHIDITCFEAVGFSESV